MAELAVEIWRGQRVESRAFADVAVVDSLGHVAYWLGDPHRETFWRSSAKPFQAMPIIIAGGAERFGFGPQDVAITTASHGGEAFHLALVQDLLSRIGAKPSDLICGIHPPSHRPTAEDLTRRGEAPSVLHNNCSGKHTGMLALARALDVPFTGYEAPDHPVQKTIRKMVAKMARIPREDSIYTAVDGCGVPTFYLPLSKMALAYARLVDPRGLDTAEAGAALIVAEAMRMHPEVVSGTGRLEVTLAQATRNRLVSKGGAEGVFCVGIPERGLGVAVKVDDGGARAIPALVTAVLTEIKALTDEEVGRLSSVMFSPVKNHAGNEVGRIEPVFHLKEGRLA